MRKIKEPKNNNKVSRKDSDLNYPVFCFKYLTTNNKYNINFLKKSRDKQKAYGALFYKINELQTQKWEEIYMTNKEVGLETIKFNNINFNPNNLKLTQDTKVISIRFKRGKYRIIGIKSSKNKDVFHVIGFDFNYSAYNHGS